MNIKNMFHKLLSRGPVTVSLAVVLSVLFVTGLVSAATTISTNIVTAGTLQVDSTSNLKGAVDMDSTLNVDSTSTFVGAVTLSSTAAATTTIKALSGSATQGFCLQFNATSSNTLLNMTFAATTTLTQASGVGPVVKYGACN